MFHLPRPAAALALAFGLASAASAQVPPPAAPVTPPAPNTQVPPSVGQPPAVVPALVAPAAPEPRPTGVAAKVNSQDIQEVAVYRALRQFPKDEWPIARKEILNHLVENTLIDQYLTALKVTATVEEVNKLVDELKGELQKANKDYAKELEAMMLTEAEFRAEVGAQMKWDKFLKDRATDAELQKMFTAAPTMFDGSMVRARHILISPVDDKAKQDKAAQDLRAIKATVEAEVAKVVAAMPANATPADKEATKLKKSEDLFGAYAKQYSTCPSKKDGGDLNFFPRVGAMVEPFAKAAFDLKVGDMTDVVPTEFGYHLILVTAKNPGKQPTFEQAKEGVRAVYAMRLRDAVVAQQKKDAKIEILPNAGTPK